jgi:hypothetical protein
MIFFSGLIMHILDNNETASIFLLKLPGHRAWLPGKEAVYFLLRPLSPPTRRGLRVVLPVKAIAKPAGKDSITPHRSRKAAGKCGCHHRSFARKVNDFLHHPEESQDRNRPGGHFDIFVDCRPQPAYACKDMFLN